MAVRWNAESLWQQVVPLWPGFTVEVLPEIDSTNTELMRRARAGQTDPVLLVAERQTAGRGRLGRQWQSAAGASLTFSLGVPLAPADWSGLSLVVGTVVAEALHPAIQLKWPNDLWVEDRKLAGILIETANWSSGGVAQRYAVIGVGINLLPRDAEGLSTPPACLQDLWPEVQAPDALARLMPPLTQALRDFEQHGFAPFQARFMARDALRDRAVALSDGTAGTAHGVAADGALLVHTLRGMQTITSSEVSVRPTGKEGA